eukprot:NODE_1300_length_1791_cov_53.346523_g1234_i0.p1 GENE.NODE_1300_length_1791_cov_53.346523_g1234_i0~~NODE_1300_length_1791_cov_53.346523_g1234_i0.p1  ORF type:complete len:542 (-),score=30.78 NODE_1300_length_1791_cov_53.346523_g1234_i0:37-1662(-)
MSAHNFQDSEDSHEYGHTTRASTPSPPSILLKRYRALAEDLQRIVDRRESLQWILAWCPPLQCPTGMACALGILVGIIVAMSTFGGSHVRRSSSSELKGLAPRQPAVPSPIHSRAVAEVQPSLETRPTVDALVITPSPHSVYDPLPTLEKGTVYGIDGPRLLVPLRVLQGLDSATKALEELMYLAYQTGRIFVEPCLRTYFPERKPGFRAALEVGFYLNISDPACLSGDTGFRSYYSHRKFRATLGDMNLTTWTAAEYAQRLPMLKSKVSVVVEHPKTPACDGVAPMHVPYGRQERYCLPTIRRIEANKPYTIQEFMIGCKMNTDINIVELDGYDNNAFWPITFKRPKQVRFPKSYLWPTTHRLIKISKEEIRKWGVDERLGYAAIHVRSWKSWNRRAHLVERCSGLLEHHVSAIMSRWPGMKLFILSDEWDPSDPYGAVVLRLRKQYGNLQLSSSINPIDLAFVEKLIGVRSAVFLYSAYELGDNDDNCVRGASMYGMWVDIARNHKRMAAPKTPAPNGIPWFLSININDGYMNRTGNAH